MLLREYLEQLACLGNGTRHGNSVGNVLAIDALAAIDKDLSGYILCDAVIIAEIDDTRPSSIHWLYGERNCPDGTKLYKAKEKS